jgi:hypothetical protein
MAFWFDHGTTTHHRGRSRFRPIDRSSRALFDPAVDDLAAQLGRKPGNTNNTAAEILIICSDHHGAWMTKHTRSGLQGSWEQPRQQYSAPQPDLQRRPQDVTLTDRAYGLGGPDPIA